MSATISTVGIGDFAPENQVSRGFSLVMIPFGLVVISQLISAMELYYSAQIPRVKPDPTSTRLADAIRIFESIDVNNDGKLSKEEVK